jgi:hypothetical protein
MTRIARLHRSAAVCFVGMVVPLFFTVAAFIEYIAGRPFFMVAMLTMSLMFGAGFLFFLHEADKLDKAKATAQAEAPAAGMTPAAA